MKWKIPNGQTALLEFNSIKDIEYKSVKLGKKSFTIFSTRLTHSARQNIDTPSYCINPHAMAMP
ncbi:MAG: hypothetical protein COC22_06800 [Flavobacteriaceae bacterium]|nr:MAG: hypothetical protein COC22_06800 [Flavobacteriaceae bacterium]